MRNHSLGRLPGGGVFLAGQGTRERNLGPQDLGNDVVRDLPCRQADPFQHLGAGAVVQELHRQAHFVQGGVHTGCAHFLADAGPHTAGADAVFDADDQPVAGSQRNDGFPDRQQPARVHHGGADPLGAEPVGDVEGEFGHGAHADDQHVVFAGSGRAAGQHVHAVAEAFEGFDFGATFPWNTGQRWGRP